MTEAHLSALVPGVLANHEHKGCVTILSEPFEDPQSRGYRWWCVVRVVRGVSCSRQVVPADLLRVVPPPVSVTMRQGHRSWGLGPINATVEEIREALRPLMERC